MGLTKGQVLRLVNEYIGVSNGHLGDYLSQKDLPILLMPIFTHNIVN